MDTAGDGGPTAQELLCGSCGTPSSPTARFCAECGTRLSQSTRSAEYKQVTVLFADVVHSMDIAATVGAERLREIMSVLLDRSTAVVERYGGTLSQFTGDGIMAVFGAPMALEDHAVRACLAALGLQEEAKRLAAEVHDRDGIELRLRVGLNSGRVIAGEIGSGSLGYTAVGEQVGMAQRMETVAPPGGVMLSASTARLVDSSAALGEAELVQIKGADEPVRVHRLLGMGEQQRVVGAVRSRLVGRRREMAAVERLLDRAVNGHGSVVSVEGSPGIGKSRVVREATELAIARGVEVFTAYCESHAADIPFHIVAQLLCAITGIKGLDPQAARARIRSRAPDVESEDMLLFEDLLGIADPEAKLPKIDPDARRRRLTALVNSVSLARQAPAVYVVEDVHWIDAVSESMLNDFVTVMPQTHSLVLISYRPEYRGTFRRVTGAQSISLAPLSDAETAALVTGLLGPDSSVGRLATMIVDRAAGNPFFAEEMVRELADRGVLQGNRSAYVSTVGAAEVSVPATVQATIAARIDRLNPAAKRTLGAAAVIGSHFDPGLLETLGIEFVIDDLVAAELVDLASFTRGPRYAFHHPLIRTVAYEAQLKSDRAELHRRLAAAIETGDPGSAEQNAALIAEHLGAAGDGRAAYNWHMRAAAWAKNRDIAAARLSWGRAARIADSFPTGDAKTSEALRIAPRTMLCATAFRVHAQLADACFEELRQLCKAAGDEASLAIGMAGQVMVHAYEDRLREASQLSSEAMAVIESVGDSTLTVGLSFAAIYAKLESAEMSDVLRWSQRVVDLAEGDATRGNFVIGSPLALALTTRGAARAGFGHPGWREDLRQAVAMARGADPVTYVRVVMYVYLPEIPMGTLAADDLALREIEEALKVAERSSDDLALAHAQTTLGIALAHRPTASENYRGEKLLAEVSETFLRREHNLAESPIVNMYLARERARRGDLDDAIPLMRSTANHFFPEGRLLTWGIVATGLLVGALLDRAAEGDVAEAQAAIERLANAEIDEGMVMRDTWLVRLRALLAWTLGDSETYEQLRNRYRHMARTLGYEGHIAWSVTMP